MEEKFKIQSNQYEFPYHFLVDIDKKTFNKNLSWGLDYYNYNLKIIELVKKHIKNDILDIGCGDGFLLVKLKKKLKKEVYAVGIDLDKKPILFAQAFASNIPNLSFIVEDLNQFEEKFNLITCVETLEHIPDDKIGNFIAQIDKHLLEKGILIVSVPSKNVKLHRKHYRHYDIKMLREYFHDYKILETHFITNINSYTYKIIEFLLCNGRLNFNISIFKKFLFYLNKRFHMSVDESKGGHIILVLKK